MIKFVAGLGNPGEKYEQTRHNAGFLVIDNFATKMGLEWKKRGDSYIVELKNEEEDCILFKSLEFMNLSGRLIAEYVNYHKIDPSEVLIVHDDLDLPYGKIQMKFGGAAGGHHGVESVVKELGSDQFWRLRIGVGRPAVDETISPADYVLMNFTHSDQEKLTTILDEAVLFLVESIQNKPVVTSKTV